MSKQILIKNLVIQFDEKGNEGALTQAFNVIDLINKTLQEANLECQPQIMASHIDHSDLESEPSFQEDQEEE